MVPKALQLGSQDLHSVHRSGKSLGFARVAVGKCNEH